MSVEELCAQARMQARAAAGALVNGDIVTASVSLVDAVERLAAALERIDRTASSIELEGSVA